jgi:glycerophosphoryl diester phosphodiesterase
VIKPLIIGHRGAPDKAPENTESAFQAAIDAGAAIIETDVRLTGDGHIVVAHDPDFSGLGGPLKPIIRSTRSEIEQLTLKDPDGRTEKPLFMDDALTRFPDIAFSVDIKDSGTAAVTAWTDLIRRSGAENRCRTASFRDRTLRIYRRMNPGAPISVARFGVAWLLFTTLLGYPRPPGKDEGVLQLPERAGPVHIITPERILRWQKCGWKVQVWTIDDESEMRRFIRWGIDGIITNRPSLLKGILDTSFS